MKVTVTGTNALYVFDKKQLKKTMRQVGQEVAAVARGLIRAAGRARRKGQALPPGSPPSSRSGMLAKSIRVQMLRSGDGVVVKDVARSKAGFPYAIALEGGSKGGGPGNKRTGPHKKGQYAQNGSRVQLPYPFLSTAVDMREASIDARVKAAVIDGIAFKKMKP